MSGFLYFIEGAVSASQRTLEAAGLWPVLAGTDVASRQDYSGPGGIGGLTVMGTGGSAELCIFDKEKQTWARIENRGQKTEDMGQRTEDRGQNLTSDVCRLPSVWIGYWNERPPVEAELRRKIQLAGHKVELRENEKWLVPVARMIAGGCALPQSFVLGSNCEVIESRLLTKYAAFWGRVEAMWDNMASGQQIDVKGCFGVAVEALQFNYHLGIDEINILGLITSANFFNGICGAVLDLPGLDELKKKDEARAK